MMRRFPLCFQHDSMQCGVACLQMVCSYFGQPYSMEYLSEFCFATAQGVSLLSISEAADSLGLQTVSGKLSVEKLAISPLPCILHWRQNHFVVLYKVKKGRRFYIADPAKGYVTYTTEEMENHWAMVRQEGERKGIAMFLQPTEQFLARRPEVAKKGESHSLRFLYGYVRGCRKSLAWVFLGLLVGSGFQMLLPYFTQAIVDRGIKQHDIDFVWLVLLGQMMLTFSRTAIDFVRRRILLRISMHVNLSLVSDFFVKLFRLPMSFFDTRHLGDILQRISDHGRVNQFLTGQALNIMFSLLGFVVFGVVLCLYSGQIFFIFVVGTLCYALWVTLFLRRRRRLDYELFECQADNSNKTFELVTSMQEIKLQNCERRQRQKWEDVQRRLFGIQMKSLRLEQAQQAGSLCINELKNILVTVVSAMAVIRGDLTLGMMLAIQYIIGQLNSPVEQLLSFLYSLQDVKISLERINEIHRRKDEDEDCSEKMQLTPGVGTLHLRHVDFKYDPHALHNTLSDVSLDIEEGKVTAIVGASGSGKTTLVKLLLGYYPTTAGEILIGDQTLGKVNKKWWRSQCGVVMQDGVIFSETVARNIAVDDEAIDKERMALAARVACIEDMVMALPLRYETKIGRDGMGVSQGQKQRLLIARAVYKCPKYIFLDEATNSLDAKNERDIVSRLNEFSQGRTVIIVAHRLSTVRHADSIVVLDGGRIVERGTHEELVALRGAYYHLVKNQLELGC